MASDDGLPYCNCIIHQLFRAHVNDMRQRKADGEALRGMKTFLEAFDEWANLPLPEQERKPNHEALLQAREELRLLK